MYIHMCGRKGGKIDTYNSRIYKNTLKLAALAIALLQLSSRRLKKTLSVFRMNESLTEAAILYL